MEIIETKEDYNKSSLGLIPNDWKQVHLNEVAKVIDGDRSSNYPSGNDIVDEGILFLSTKNIVNSFFDYHDTRFISKEKFDSIKKGKLKKDDLVITMRGSIGNVARFTGVPFQTALINAQMSIIRPTGINSEYLWSSLNSFIMPRYLQKITSGSAQPQLTKKDVEKIPIPLPPIGEQQKIALILSTWDKAIELKEKLIEQKKQQKKGLMQKLLTGEVRLPGFEGEWKKVRLGKIGKTYNGLSGKKAEDFGEGKPYIPYKAIFDNSKIYINKFEYVRIEENEKQNIVKYGDIFFTTSSETPDEVGMSSVLLEDVNEVYLNSFCFGYRLNNFDTLIPEFAQFLFRSDSFRRSTFKLAQGSTRFNISKNEMMKITVLLPSIEEQKAIAEVLSNADREIKLLKKQVNFLKEQKKGLMQLLLTGKVRVKV
ncbi:restriction endonuclease subunit S [Heyndrickxia coagulans]|uniref:restriction endonuclease subunit S n=1 Tax=Heyndrickxia coagulans TaxID=1398 RepID=UPI002DF76516|nr:restriction endonuclease subunit S [Heyndrickxia coagulans]MEC5270311.1 restriction endonuclease subunit S [Heyndrickxia coagulans]